MKLLITPAIALALLSGCASQQYYEEQPYRDDAETERVAAIGDGLEKVVKAFRGGADHRAANSPVAKKSTRKKTCVDCGGGMVDDLPPTEAVVQLEQDPSGQINPTAIFFKDASTAKHCTQDSPCLEGSGETYDGHDGLQAPVKGTGQAITIYNTPSVDTDGGFDARNTGISQPQTEEYLLLQYIMMERQAAAEQAAKAEETRQLQAIMTAYENAILKKQPKQAAPYTPESTLNKVVDNLPFLGAIWGMSSLGRAGIEGARGDTTANTTITKETDITSTTNKLVE